MAVVVVRFPRGRAAVPGTSRPKEAVGAAPLPRWLTVASLAAFAAGTALVYASMLPAPPLLRAALIAAGALLGLSGLAVLAADVCREPGRPPRPAR